MSGLSVRLPANSPTWLLALTIVALLLAAAIVGLVRLVRHALPQDSRDRLAWWQDRREFRARRKHERHNHIPPSPALPRRTVCARRKTHPRRTHYPPTTGHRKLPSDGQ